MSFYEIYSIPFSARTGWTLTSNPLTRARRELETDGITVLDLTESNPTRCGFDYLSEDLLRPLLAPQNLHYDPDPHGLRGARLAIGDYYRRKGVKVGADQIFITANTSEAYSFVFRLLTNAGEAVLTPRPGYPLLEYLTGLSDLKQIPYPLQAAQGWQMDFQKMRESITPKTRSILVVHPNNPTGNYLTEVEKNQLHALCEDHCLAVVADEVFFDYAHSQKGKPVFSFADESEMLTFTLGGISKCLGLPQMKLSWIVVSGPPALRRDAVKRLEVIADSYLSASTPIQRALPVWMQRQGEISGEILKRCQSNFSALEQTLCESPEFEVLKPEGGWYALLRLRSQRTDEQAALDLLENKHVFLHPGYFYDFAEDQYLILSLLPEPRLFAKAVARL